MEKKKEPGAAQEIVSFNMSVLELPSLLELDDALLDMVAGGANCEKFSCAGFHCQEYYCQSFTG